MLSIEKDSVVASSSPKDALDLLEAAKFLLDLGCSEWDEEFVNRIVHILLTHEVRKKKTGFDPDQTWIRYHEQKILLVIVAVLKHDLSFVCTMSRLIQTTT